MITCSVCDLTHLSCAGRQSPINIVTANVRTDTTLSPLVFSSNWGKAVTSGVLANNGHSVQLTLDSKSPIITTQTPVGKYQLLQLHFHWGSRSGTGSEHLINGRQSELEIHFVHKRIGPGNAGNALAVVSVLADVSNSPISGVWKTLQVSGLKQPHKSTTIKHLTLSSLLPGNRDYYHYPGSLTTPPCTESVQWFVLKDRITVPAAYLTVLRGLNTEHGTPLTHNFRMPQPLGSRTVTSPSGQSRVLTALELLLIEII